MHQTALLIIDVQEKLVNVMHDGESLVKNISILAQAAEILSIPILWCQQYPKALGATVEQVARHLEKTEPTDKMCFSCCDSQNFMDRLRKLNAEKIIVCGIESHICVYQSAVALASKGYEVQVVADAVSSRTAQNKQIALNRLAARNVDVSSVEMTLFELLGSAEHPCFKQISKLIK